MYKACVFLFTLVFITFSCNSSSSGKVSDTISKQDSEAGSSVRTEKPVTDTIPWSPNGDPVDIVALKKQFGHAKMLSSVKGGSENSLCGDSTKGFFGNYYFLDSISLKNFDKKNQLTVFKAGRPEHWMMDAADERFVSITLKNPGIRLWNRLEVGMRMDSIGFGLIHSGPESYPWSSIYLNGYDVRCRCENDIVQEWEVSKPCK